MKILTTPSKRFYGYLKKDFQLLVQRKKYLYLFILLPLVIASLFLFALNPGEYEISVGVCDFDNTDISKQAVNNLNGFRPLHLDRDNCLETLDSKLKTGELDLGIEIGNGFSNNLENLEQSKLVIYYDNTDVALSNVISWKVDNSLDPLKREIIDELNTELNSRVENIRSNLEIIQDFDDFTSSAIDKRVDAADKDLQKIEQMNTEFLVKPIWTDKRPIYENSSKKDAGIAYIFPILAIFIILMLSSTSIIYDKQTNYLTRIKSTTTPISYIVAKVLFFTSLVAAQFLIIFAIFLLSGATYSPSLIGILQLILLIGIIDTLIGLIIGLTTNSEGIAVLFSLMISFPLMLVSGVFFPTQSLPRLVQWIGKILPLEFQINASKTALLFGQSIGPNWIYIATILFIVVLFLIRKD